MSPPRRTSSRRQRTGIAEIDVLLAQIVDIVGGPDADVIAEAIASVVRLGVDGTDRGNLKIVAGALRELRRAFLLYEQHEHIPKVSVFGSARTPEEDPNYSAAMVFSRLMVDNGWMPITGGGPGIMQAANEGAGPGRSFGLNIRLPFEQTANPYIEGDPNLVTFRYFFTRKLEFAKEARAYAFFPGGFGTLDEAFEVLTLTQTGKGVLQPIVFVEAEGERYWDDFLGFVRRHLLDGGYVDREDLELVRLASRPEEAVAEILGFYRNFRSQRYVDGRLYLRVTHAPTDGELAALNLDFADIVLDGEIEVVPAHPDEVADADEVDAARVAFDFDRRNFGRLRRLVDALNQLPSLDHERPG